MDEVRAMVNPNRAAMYERTILTEWLLFALMILGYGCTGHRCLPFSGIAGARSSRF